MFLNYIKECIEINAKGIISPQIAKIGNDFYFEFFDREMWRVKITFGMLDKTWKDKIVDSDRLIYLAVKELLKQQGILHNELDEKVHRITDFTTSTVEFGRGLMNQFTSQALTIFVSGKRKSGKTTLIKQFCNNHHENEYIWLDFNGAAVDFSEIILNLIKRSYVNPVKIIIDNLECCGYDTAKNILLFFVELTNILQQKGKNVQLIISQDEAYRLDKFVNNLDTSIINVTKEQTLMDCCEIEKDVDYINDLEFIKYFKKNNVKFENIVNGFNTNQRKLFLKILVLISLGIEPKIYKGERTIVKELIFKEECLGLKVFVNGKVTYYDQDFCINMLEHGGVFESGDSISQIFRTYCNSNKLNFNEIVQILTNKYCTFPVEEKKDFINLIELAQKLLDEIKSEILAESNNKTIFGNHLGAILFAAETLSHYAEEDWDALAAWKRVAKYIENVFYIDGQKLPEIRVGKEKEEQTYLDFDRNNINANCIKNQIKLQDEMLEKYLDVFDEKDIEDIEGENFCYFLSDYQKEKNDIDIEKFYQTYILSLLFEFEVTAPKSQRNKEKIIKLFKKIVLNAQRKENAIYFYPARVPWVTARMLLALCAWTEVDVHVRSEFNKLKEGMCKWLRLCNILFVYEGSRYRIWTAGTGKWNSVLETTMMCTFALSEAGKNNHVVEEGIRYIQARENEWFVPKSIADGIWAYQTICMANTRQRDTERMSSVSKYVKSCFDAVNIADKNMKNDKSLGNTHIAKTLISILKDFSESLVKDIALNYFNYERVEIGMNGNTNERSYKIGVTFTGTHREKIVEPVCNTLLNWGYEKKDIFYDNWHESKINGINADVRLRKIYQKQCECVVVFLSKDYKDKNWTGNVEWRAIKELINTAQENRICLLNVDGVDLDIMGSLSGNQDIATPIENKSIEEIAEIIDEFYDLYII